MTFASAECKLATSNGLLRLSRKLWLNFISRCCVAAKRADCAGDKAKELPTTSVSKD
jgi:hypothetical protein